MTQKLYVKSEIEKILFFNEIRGQISDGLWENSRPSDHYRFWCDFTPDDVIVTNDNNTGIKTDERWKIRKNNYNFTNSKLLKYVGDRMLNIVKTYLLYKDSDIDIDFYNMFTFDNDMAMTIDKYFNEDGTKKFNFTKNFTPEMVKKINVSNIYTMKELKKELEQLKIDFGNIYTY